MRFNRPMPGRTWPQGMAIRVDETPHQLSVLLFIRNAWGVAPDADVPRLDPQPDVGFSRIPETAARNEPAAYSRALRAAAGTTPPQATGEP